MCNTLSPSGDWTQGSYLTQCLPQPELLKEMSWFPCLPSNRACKSPLLALFPDRPMKPCKNPCSFLGLASVSFSSWNRGKSSLPISSLRTQTQRLVPSNLGKHSKAWMSLNLVAPKGLSVGILFIGYDVFYYHYSTFNMCRDITQYWITITGYLHLQKKNNLFLHLQINLPINIKT